MRSKVASGVAGLKAVASTLAGRPIEAGPVAVKCGAIIGGTVTLKGWTATGRTIAIEGWTVAAETWAIAEAGLASKGWLVAEARPTGRGRAARRFGAGSGVEIKILVLGRCSVLGSCCAIGASLLLFLPWLVEGRARGI